MEEDGVVGPFQGSKPREVLLTKEAWQEMRLKKGEGDSAFAMAQQMSEAADAAAAAGEEADDLPWTVEETVSPRSGEER